MYSGTVIQRLDEVFMRFVVVTGMSGGGKTTAMKMLEDAGYYCVDNLPISLLGKFVELMATPTSVRESAMLQTVLPSLKNRAISMKFCLWMLLTMCCSSVTKKPDVYIQWHQMSAWK